MHLQVYLPAAWHSYPLGEGFATLASFPVTVAAILTCTTLALQAHTAQEGADGWQRPQHPVQAGGAHHMSSTGALLMSNARQ